jgi:hypothetical protein
MRKTRLALAAIGLAPFGMLLASCSGGSSWGGGFASSASTGSTSNVTPGTSPTTPATSPVITLANSAPTNLATGPDLVFDTTGTGGFFDQPFPIDTRVLPNGAPNVAGMPNPEGQWFINEMIALVQSETVGFSPSAAIYFQFNAPINVPADDPVASVASGATVFLACVDSSSTYYLERNPVHIAYVATNDSVLPANFLEILPVPGKDMHPNTTYAAVVLRSVGTSSGNYLGQSPALTSLLAGVAPTGSSGLALAQAYAPLVAALPALGVQAKDIAAATVFTTGDPAACLYKQVPYVASLPPITPNAIGVRDVYPTFTALKGDYNVPQYQQGTPPFLISGGEQVVDQKGLPQPQYYADVNFQLSIPNGKMPAAGFPLYFYVHGTGGDSSQAIDRGYQTNANVNAPLGSGIASWVAPQGWATSCVTLPLTPERLGFWSFDGYAAYNFFNPVAFRDNFKQMLLELVHFRSMVLSIRIDPSLCPGTDASASPDGKIGFDPDTMIVGGQSLGSYLAGMLSSMFPWKGAILSGAGGSWLEFPFGPTDPFTPAQIINIVAMPSTDTLNRFHPLIELAEMAVGPVDNMFFLRHTLREPFPGFIPPHIFVVEGHDDHQVPENLQRALILALGLDLAGPEVCTGPADSDAVVLPIGGLTQLPYPVQGNFTLPMGDVRTAAFVRYEHDPVMGDGHYVFFQTPAVIPQVQTFLQGIQTGVVPSIVQ